MAERARRAGALLAVACAGACSTDTSGLARREPVEALGGAAGASGGVAGSAGGTGDGAGGTGDGAGPAPLEGPGALSVVHGIVDGGALFVCGGGPAAALLAGDAAAPEEGLPYGGVLELPTLWELAAEDAELTLFVAEPSRWAGSSCADLAAAADPASPGRALDASVPDGGLAEPPFPLAPERPRRAGAAQLAAGSLRPGARYALIVAGCTGPGALAQAAVCGEPEPLFGGTTALVLVEISSEIVADTDTLGLQFVNASRAVPRADLTLQSESGPAGAPLGSDVAFAAVRPRRAAAVVEPVGVELHVQRERLPSYTQAWADTVGDLADGGLLGQNHLLAYVGPVPAGNVLGLAPPRFVLIPGR